MNRSYLAGLVLALAAASSLVSHRQASASSYTYIALGASDAFGETDFSQNPSFGDRGYVSLYANDLATLHGGVRPNVINLAIDGEDSNTFFNGGLGAFRTPSDNLNYVSPSITQNALFLSMISAEAKAGHAIDTVSIQLGADNFDGYLIQHPDFLTLSPIAQQAVIAQVTNGLVTNYTTLLTEVRTLLPTANLLLIGYFDPFPPVRGLTPFADFSGPVVSILNQVIGNEAAAFGATFVNPYPAFVGHEAAYTFITTPPFDPTNPNDHPNATGYAVIAQLMVAAVPEPPSAALMVMGVPFVLALTRRARTRGRRAC